MKFTEGQERWRRDVDGQGQAGTSLLRGKPDTWQAEGVRCDDVMRMTPRHLRATIVQPRRDAARLLLALE